MCTFEVFGTFLSISNVLLSVGKRRKKMPFCFKHCLNSFCFYFVRAILCMVDVVMGANKFTGRL